MNVGLSQPVPSKPGQDMQPQRVLVLTSVAGEREAVLRGLGNSPRFDVLAGGVGPAAAAASTAAALAKHNYDLVVVAGIGGGFAGRAEIGSLVVASEIVAADLGAESPAGFLSLEELGLGASRIPVDARLSKRVMEALRSAGLPVCYGPVLTLSTVTGTQATAEKLAERVPGAAAEAMEGYGAAVAAQACGLPVLEVRAISNRVGPRDRSAWRITEALALLEAAGAVFSEVLA